MSEQQTFQFSFDAEIVPRGDGSFLIKPGKPKPGRQKVSITEAVRRLGLSRSTWIRLFESGLVEGERPSPKKIFLYLDSATEHLRRSSDSEFWTKERRKKFLEAI